MMYVHDERSDWAEGMNEYGIGIVAASLHVTPSRLKKKFPNKHKTLHHHYDKRVIKALSEKTLKSALDVVIGKNGNFSSSPSIVGMTMLANSRHGYVIEATPIHEPVVEKTDNTKVTVRTNHGIHHEDVGHLEGIKRKSSISRMELAQKHLNDVKNPDAILDTMSKQWVSNKFLNLYRRTNQYNVQTTSQIMLNLSDLEFNFRWDKNHSTFEGYVNELPDGYKPKIKLNLLQEIK